MFFAFTRRPLKEQGFTLIELCIVLIVLSMMMVGMLAAYKNYMATKRQAEFTATMNTVTSALAYYIRDEGEYRSDDPRRGTKYGSGAGINNNFDATRYPCPAAPEIGVGQNGFGVERRNLNSGSCQEGQGVIRVNTPSGAVFIGSVPTATLEISGNHMLDGYGRRLTYAVSDSVSHSRPTAGAQGGALGGENNPPGAITVRHYYIDSGGGVTNRDVSGVPFFLFSHGKDGMGAYTPDGVRTSDCTGTSRDAENCNGDARFVESNVERGTLTTNNAYYDDTAVFTLRGIADKEDFWGMGTDTRNITNINQGNVGINTLTPAQRLEVRGNILARSFLHFSDARLKENVADLDADTIKKIMMMRLVSYDLISEKSDHKKFGVIAQELQKIYPELVYTDDAGYLNVDYVGLTGPIIKALQQLSADKDKEIGELRGEIKALDERLKALEAKLVSAKGADSD